MKNEMLNGRFSRWLTRAVSKVVDYAADKVNSSTFGIFRSFVNRVAARANEEIAQLGRTMVPSNTLQVNPQPTTAEPTAQEEVILNAFVDKFKVFVTSIIAALDNANNDLTTINAQLAKMGIVQNYFRINELTGLSVNARDLREELINEMFTPIYEIIDEKATGRTKTTATVIANQTMFAGLFSTSVNGLSYTVQQYAIANSSNNTLTITPIGIKTLSPIKSDLSITAEPMFIKNVPAITTAIAPTKINITGFVYDDKGVIPGANITIGGTSYNPTDVNGKFSLKNIDENAMVSVSFMGYKTKTVKAQMLVDGLTTSTNRIILEAETNALNEIEIKNLYNKKSFWWVLLLVGAVTIGGYLYTRDPQTKKIIKTKI